MGEQEEFLEQWEGAMEAAFEAIDIFANAYTQYQTGGRVASRGAAWMNRYKDAFGRHIRECMRIAQKSVAVDCQVVRWYNALVEVVELNTGAQMEAFNRSARPIGPTMGRLYDEVQVAYQRMQIAIDALADGNEL